MKASKHHPLQILANNYLVDYKVIAEKTAELLGEDISLVREVIDHNYGLIRKEMDNLNVPSMQVPGLGTFEVLSPAWYRVKLRKVIRGYRMAIERGAIKKAHIPENYFTDLINKLFKKRRLSILYHEKFKDMPKKGVHMKNLFKNLKNESTGL